MNSLGGDRWPTKVILSEEIFESVHEELAIQTRNILMIHTKIAFGDIDKTAKWLGMALDNSSGWKIWRAGMRQLKVETRRGQAGLSYKKESFTKVGEAKKNPFGERKIEVNWRLHFVGKWMH